MMAKLKMSDARLAKNAVFSIKKDLLKTFNDKLKNKNNNTSSNFLIEQFATQQKKKDNQALIR